MSARNGISLIICLGTAGSLVSAASAEDGLVSVQQAKLVAFDGLPDDRFGTSVGVSGDRLVTGAPGNDDQGDDAGAVYAFVRNGGAWSVIDQIIPQQVPESAQFGLSVAIDGDTFAASAPFEPNGGAVYVFRWSGVQWNQEARLTGADTAAGDLFGYFVALEGHTLVVGAVGDDQSRGAAYVFDRAGTTWSQNTKLTAADANVGDWFGRAVAISGATLVVGAPLGDVNGLVNAGAAYVFDGSGPQWTPLTKLIAPKPALGAVYGAAAAVVGDHLVIGAEHDSLAAVDAGACYTYERVGGVWQSDETLTMVEPLTGSEYADSVAIADSGFGTFIVVGASIDAESVPGGGSAYVYQRTLDGWKQAAVLTPSDPAGGALFGSSVAVDQNTVVVGSPLPSTIAGSAYVFVETPVSGAGVSLTAVDIGGDLKGRIELPGEVDGWVFAALAGSSLQFKITGKSGLVPSFRLVDHDTGADVPGVTVTGQGNAKVAVSVEPLADTARYRVEIGSLSNSAGTYLIDSTIKLPPTKQSESFSSPQSDDVLTVAFDATPGTVTRLKASHIDQNEAPLFLALIGPDGPVAFGQKKKPKAKNPISVTDPIELDVLGSYVGFVEVQDGGGKVKVVVDSDPPKAPTKAVEGLSKAVSKAGKKLAKIKAPQATLRSLRDDAAVVHDLIEDPLLGYRLSERSIATAFKKSKDVTNAWAARLFAGHFQSLRFLPTEGVYDASDFSKLDIPPCPSEPETVLYVLLGNQVLASSALNSAMHLYHALRSADPALAAQVEVRALQAFFVAGGGGGVFDESSACLGVVAQVLPLCELADLPGTAAFWDVLAAPYRDTCAAVEKACKKVDLSSGIIGWPASTAQQPAGVIGVTRLAWMLRHDVLSGRRVVVVAHGQGNAYLNSAMIALSATQRARVGVVAVASPLNYADPGSFGRFAQLTLEHDAVLDVPGAPPANLANQWSEFFELPCTNEPALCALEDAYLAAAIHAFDLSYLGNGTSRAAILGEIQASAASIPAAPLLGQGVLQVTVETDVDSIVALHVVEPTGTDVSFTDPNGDAGSMDLTHLSGGKVENYYVCQPANLLPGKYDVFVDNFEQAISIGEAVRVMIRAGDVAYVRTLPLQGSQDPPLIPVARIKVDEDGAATVQDL